MERMQLQGPIASSLWADQQAAATTSAAVAAAAQMPFLALLQGAGVVVEEAHDDGRKRNAPAAAFARAADLDLLESCVTQAVASVPAPATTRAERRRKRPRPRARAAAPPPEKRRKPEEAESQRMTHIAVERNRRRQMNEYLRILRSLMPGSYVQRGDQASIIGGAIEFIRELEQLIQCLESQKRRRLYGGSGEPPRPVVDAAGAGAPPSTHQQNHQPQVPSPAAAFFPPSLPFPVASGGGDGKILDLEAGGGGTDAGGLREEVAENKSCLADIEVRALGADAMIKILSRRRPGQLIKTIAALEDMQMSILHTNITTIEQTVLYSFNVKILGEARYSAEDIAGAVHQILSFIDVNYAL